jgi:polyisoprenoid-binding protein YceI
MKFLTLATLAALTAGPALAAAEKYTIDPSHAQIVFSWNHLGFSTTTHMYSGFGGDIMWDKADPAASTVSVTFPVRSMITGWDERFGHLMSADFFNAADDSAVVTFTSTAIEVTGETTANITGDLTVNGVTKPVVLAATLNGQGMHPMANQEWAGFDATATLKRSDFNLGAFTPFVADDIAIEISIEAAKAAE